MIKWDFIKNQHHKSLGNKQLDKGQALLLKDHHHYQRNLKSSSTYRNQRTLILVKQVVMKRVVSKLTVMIFLKENIPLVRPLALCIKVSTKHQNQRPNWTIVKNETMAWLWSFSQAVFYKIDKDILSPVDFHSLECHLYHLKQIMQLILNHRLSLWKCQMILDMT